jgi:hypothetical protein
VKITYILDLDQAKVKLSFREPSNAKWVNSEDGAVKILTFSDEIPVPSEMGRMFSPFLATFGNIEDLDAFRKDEGLRQAFIKQLFPLAERCLIHFERGNWDLFDKESPHPRGEAVTVRDRLVALYTFLTAAFMRFTLNSKSTRSDTATPPSSRKYLTKAVRRARTVRLAFRQDQEAVARDRKCS